MKTPGMHRSLALFLQVALVLIGLALLAFLLGEPHFEGRNAHATTYEVYFHDPFLAYVYVGSSPFFVALYRAFGLLGHVRRTGSFSTVTVDALRAIKRCGLVMLGFVIGGAIFILFNGDKDDRPPGLVMSLLAASVATGIALVAAKLARALQGALRRADGLAT